jgi:hypothetical protein
MRYAPGALHAQFGEAIELIEHEAEVHHAPGSAVQQFVFCLCVMHKCDWVEHAGERHNAQARRLSSEAP